MEDLSPNLCVTINAHAIQFGERKMTRFDFEPLTSFCHCGKLIMLQSLKVS